MTLQKFIKENRLAIDQTILRILKYPGEFKNLNDKERRLWILNDEGLYNWARSEGIKI